MIKSRPLLILAALLLLVVRNAFAASCPVSPAQITSLPCTADTPNATYLVGPSLPTVNSGDAITVTANDVVIDGQGNAITYCNTGPGVAIVVNLPGITYATFEIKNLTLTQGAYTINPGEDCEAIRRSGNYRNVSIHDNTINISHPGSVVGDAFFVVQLTDYVNDSSGNSISHNTLNLSGACVSLRGIVIAPQTGSSAKWDGSVDNNTINMTNNGNVAGTTGTRCGGISISGSTDNGIIQSNTINVDNQTSQNTAIGVAEGSGWRVDSNRIVSNCNICRGILFDNADNSAITNNLITMGDNVVDSQDSLGIRLRFGSDNDIVYHNLVNVPVASGGLGSGGAEGTAFAIGGTEPVPGHTTPGFNDIVRDNTFDSQYRAVAVLDGENVHFYHNTINGTTAPNVFPILIQNSQTGLTTNVTFTGDTINGTNTSTCSPTACSVYILSNIQNVVFCDTNITPADVTIPAPNTGTPEFITGCPLPSNNTPMPPYTGPGP